MAETGTNAGNVPLEGGKLCVDFTNTVSWRNSTKQKELLNDFSDLILWGKHVGILEDKFAHELLKKASQNQSEAKRVYDNAINLRETLFQIFASIATKSEVKSDDLSIFNRYFADTMGKSCCIKGSKDRFIWSFYSDKDSLDYILNPIIKSAADLLLSSDLKQLKKCADKYCGWLFIDMSRNKSRRWCNMKDCGNRAKARRYYQQKRKEKSG